MEKNRFNSVSAWQNVKTIFFKRKWNERMDPPAIVHGRAYGKRDLILVHFNDILPKDGNNHQAFGYEKSWFI
jgi:hypothetical protein